jgi:hypothetical protein
MRSTFGKPPIPDTLPEPKERIDQKAMRDFWSWYWPDVKADQRLGQAFCNFFNIRPYPEFFHTEDASYAREIIRRYSARYVHSPDGEYATDKSDETDRGSEGHAGEIQDAADQGLEIHLDEDGSRNPD